MVQTGLVTIGRFLRREDATVLRIRLSSDGINAAILGDMIPSVQPAADWADGGVRLAVPADELEKARAILSIPLEETRLPDDFVPPESPPEETSQDRTSLAILESLSVTVWIPVVAACLWELGCWLFTDSRVWAGSPEESRFVARAAEWSALAGLWILARTLMRSSSFPGKATVKEESRNPAG